MSRSLTSIILFGALALGAAAILLPFAWMVSVSLKPHSEVFTADFAFFPIAPTLANYWHALTQTRIPLYLLNGVIVTGGILVLQLAVTVPCAYALAHRQFVGRRFLFGAVVAALLVPFHVTAIPIFLGFAQIGILNTYTALILPFMATAFGLFLLRQAYAQIPDEVIAAARVDGMSETGHCLAHRLSARSSHRDRVLDLFGDGPLERSVLAAHRHDRPRSGNATTRHPVFPR
jgi:multiple sugar transport system permease protein